MAAFQSPRPTLHFSALRATASLARCWCRGNNNNNNAATTTHPLSSLVSLVVVQLQNDSPFHRWRALLAHTWLLTDLKQVCVALGAELRLGELSHELVQSLFVELLSRCQSNPQSGVVYAGVALDALVLWRLHSPKTVDAVIMFLFLLCVFPSNPFSLSNNRTWC
jgi:hypothetical protein